MNDLGFDAHVIRANSGFSFGKTQPTLNSTIPTSVRSQYEMIEEKKRQKKKHKKNYNNIQVRTNLVWHFFPDTINVVAFQWRRHILISHMWNLPWRKDKFGLKCLFRARVKLGKWNWSKKAKREKKQPILCESTHNKMMMKKKKKNNFCPLFWFVRTFRSFACAVSYFDSSVFFLFAMTKKNLKMW